MCAVVLYTYLLVEFANSVARDEAIYHVQCHLDLQCLLSNFFVHKKANLKKNEHK